MEELVLDPKDDKLLEEDFGGGGDLKRSQRHAKIISWMRRPDYISTEQTRFQPSSMEQVESKIGYVVRKKMGGEQVHLSRP
jgi:RNA polymerase II-associated factor 1